MKSSSAALATFMENTTTFFRADLYTITLPGGAVLRWSGASMLVTSSIQVAQQSQGPFTWVLGPPIGDKGVSNARGVQAGSVDIVISCGDGRFTIGGEDIRDFAFQKGFDGALVRIDRAYAASAAAMALNGPVGSYCRFSGRYSETKELGATQVILTCTDFRDCLDSEFPNFAYQSSCNNVFGDANCGVNLASLTTSTTVVGSANTTTAINVQEALTDGGLNLGSATFTSGANQGLQRSIKGSAASGNGVALTAPLPTAPAAGDAVSLCPGCPLTTAGCQSYQSAVPSGTPWMQRFRGHPFIPPPSTGLPT